MPELEAHSSARVRCSRDDVVSAPARRVRAGTRGVAVMAGPVDTVRAVVEVALSTTDGNGDEILAWPLEAVVVVVEEERSRLRANTAVFNAERAVEEPGVVLEPHRPGQASKVHRVGRRVRPLTGVDHAIDRGRRRRNRPLVKNRRGVVCPSYAW